MTYYRISEDFRINVMALEEYANRFKNDIVDRAVSFNDALGLDEVVGLVDRDASLAAQVRQAQALLEYQDCFLGAIEEARVTLERELAQRDRR